MSLADLCEHVAKIRSTFKVRARVRVHQATDMPIGSEKTIDFDVSFSHGIQHYGWVNGGLLLPGFLLQGGTRMFLDRNARIFSLRSLSRGAGS